MNNVAPRDVALLLHPKYPENAGRVCTVGDQIPNIGLFKDKGVVWFCTFPTNIKTDAGTEFPFATIEDWRLRKIAGPDIDISVTEGSDEPVCLPA